MVAARDLRADLLHLHGETLAVDAILAVVLDRLLAEQLFSLPSRSSSRRYSPAGRPAILNANVDHHRLDVLEHRVVRPAERHDDGIGRRLPRAQGDGVDGHLALAQLARLGGGRRAAVVLAVGQEHDAQDLALAGGRYAPGLRGLAERRSVKALADSGERRALALSRSDPSGGSSASGSPALPGTARRAARASAPTARSGKPNRSTTCFSPIAASSFTPSPKMRWATSVRVKLSIFSMIPSK